MSITTKKGDKGTTFIISGEELPKDSLRIELLGTIDELSAALGVARTQTRDEFIATQLLEVQEDLIMVAGRIANPPAIADVAIEDEFIKRVRHLEVRIERLEKVLPAITYFILPGANAAEAAIHHARTISRRCERAAVRLHRDEQGLSRNILISFNRLADYLWLLARWAEVTDDGQSDVR